MPGPDPARTLYYDLNIENSNYFTLSLQPSRIHNTRKSGLLVEKPVKPVHLKKDLLPGFPPCLGRGGGGGGLGGPFEEENELQKKKTDPPIPQT